MFLEPMAWSSLNSILQCAWLLWGCLSTSAYLRICNVHCPVNQQLTQSFYNHNLCRLLPGTVSVKFTSVTVVDKDIERHRHLSSQTRSGRIVSDTQVRPPVFKYSGCLRWLTVIFKVWQLDNLIFQDRRTGKSASHIWHHYRSKSVVTFLNRIFIFSSSRQSRARVVWTCPSCEELKIKSRNLCSIPSWRQCAPSSRSVVYMIYWLIPTLKGLAL